MELLKPREWDGGRSGHAKLRCLCGRVMLVGDPAVYVPTSADVPVAVCHPCGQRIVTTFAIVYGASSDVFDRLDEENMRLDIPPPIDPTVEPTEADEDVERMREALSQVDDSELEPEVSTATAVFQRASTSEW